MDNNEKTVYEDNNETSGAGFYSEDTIAARQQLRQRNAKKRLLRQRLILGGILVALIVLIVLAIRGCSKGSTEASAASASEEAPSLSGESLMLPTPDPSDTSVGQESSVEEDYSGSVTITAVGDIIAYDDQLTDAYDSVSGSYSFAHCFSQISSYLSASDITVGTLETTFAGSDTQYQGKPNFNTPESMASDLKNAGFDILSTACTYSLQHGIAGLISTIQKTRSAGLDNIGTYYTQEDRDSSGGLLIKEVNGIRIGFLSYTKGCNGISLPEGYEYAVNMLYVDNATYFSELNETQILSDLQSAKDQGCDLLIAVLHWGSEYETTPNEDQEKIATLMFENGVDIILGSHPHYLQPIQLQTVTTTDGETKEVLAAYSLGNFLSSMSKEYSNDSLILNITVSKDSDTGAIVFDNINYVPVYISGSSQRFAIYDIHQSIEDFNAQNGRTDISDDLYATLRQSLDNIHRLAGEEYDIANQITYEAAPIIGGSEAEASAEGEGEAAPETGEATETAESADAQSAA